MDAWKEKMKFIQKISEQEMIVFDKGLSLHGGDDMLSDDSHWWTNEHKNEIFRLVSLACGVSHIQRFMIKKLAFV